MPPELSFQPEKNNSKQLIAVQDAQIAQEAKYKLYYLKKNMKALYQSQPQK